MSIVHDFNHPLHRLFVWVEGGMAALRHKPDYMTVEQYEDTKKTYAQLETLIEAVGEWQEILDGWKSRKRPDIDLYALIETIRDFGKERE
jgi:hypothetical protein